MNAKLPDLTAAVSRLAEEVDRSISRLPPEVDTLAVREALAEAQRAARIMARATREEIAERHCRDCERERERAAVQATLRELRDTQAQLIEAAKMAAVGTLVAGMSHELNNPTAAILASVETMLEKTPVGTPMRRGLLVIERQALRCARLLRTLLDYAHRSPGARDPVAIEPLVHRVAEIARSALRGAGAVLDVAIAGGPLPAVRAGEDQLESALLNVVTNAMDATPRGGLVVITAAVRERAGARGVEVCVRDTGDGIAPEVLPRIFEPFFTTKPLGKGTGLGLSLTRTIVETVGGHIEIDSERGVGTTARLWFPVARDGPPAPARRA